MHGKFVQIYAHLEPCDVYVKQWGKSCPVSPFFLFHSTFNKVVLSGPVSRVYLYMLDQ